MLTPETFFFERPGFSNMKHPQEQLIMSITKHVLQNSKAGAGDMAEPAKLGGSWLIPVVLLILLEWAINGQKRLHDAACFLAQRVRVAFLYQLPGHFDCVLS